MIKLYSDERNVQIIIALMKAHGIKRIIVSPGSTNTCLVASLQSDSFFEMYSCVDERSAAYMACGMAEETCEPVMLSCTGATASRNYMPALTEAYYRRLPIIAVTSSQVNDKIGHLLPQITDRRYLPNDIAFLSVQVPVVKTNDDIWNCSIQINKAFTECRRHGGGPVHINLQTRYSKSFDVKTLPEVQIIKRIILRDTFPELLTGKIVVFIGSHRLFTEEETKVIDSFCASNDAVVFYEMSSGYHGKYGIKYELLTTQEYFNSPLKHIDLLIHIGEMAGSDSFLQLKPKRVWRVSPDGEIKDPFKKLEFIFEMDERFFFEYYNKESIEEPEHKLYDIYKDTIDSLSKMLEKAELPFSNIWMAVNAFKQLPPESEVHTGIMNSFRAWNLLTLPNDIKTYCNVGGYGIDGCVSSLIGASLVHPNKLYFGIFGDLAFFYDMNALGNHHIGSNIRILLVNNGKGNEFHNYVQPWSQFGDEVDPYGAAAGHFGNKSPNLVKHIAEDLGFEYLTASNKEDFIGNLSRFMSASLTEKPMLFEVFTEGEDDALAYKIIRRLVKNVKEEWKNKVKVGLIKSIGDDKSRKLADLLNIK